MIGWLAFIFFGSLFPLFVGAVENTDSPLETGHSMAIEVSSALSQQFRVEPVKYGRLSDTLRLPGRVQVNEQRLAQVGTPVTGRIIELRGVLGQEVKRGEVLAVLNSTELGMAQAAYLKASSQVNLRQLAVDRARRLLAGDVIGSAALQEREGQLVEAQVEMQAAADQLRLLGMSNEAIQQLASERKINSLLSIMAPLSGTVIERQVKLGQITQPAHPLYTVADLSSIWLVAQAPENQAYLIQEEEKVEAEIPALPGPTVQGQLTYVADVVDPESRTVEVRMEVPNPRRRIKPEMLSTIIIHVQSAPALVVPSHAVVREGKQDFVFVQTGPQHFTLRAVELGPDGGPWRAVRGGLAAGEPIVVEGAFHLNNERRRREVE
jgi:membrane fusion protein, heavy metal efflux system